MLVVEDIVDTGLTLTYLLRVLATRGPASLRVCALLDKRARRIVDVPLSYVGFEVPDVFLVGYGLDLDERERGRGELLAVDDLEAVRANPALLDLPTRPDGAWRPPRSVNSCRLQPSLGMSHRPGASDSLGQAASARPGARNASTPEGVSRWSS